MSSRGFARILAHETNISDLLQELSDRDLSPWTDVVGFRPTKVDREVRLGKTEGFPNAGIADLRLVDQDGKQALVEVKLGHVLSRDQQARYESWQADRTALYLVALSADAHCVKPAMRGRWTFIDLATLVRGWSLSDNEEARVLAREALKILEDWDALISSILNGEAPLVALTAKFPTRVVTRRIAADLITRGYAAYARVTSGGGLPVVQAWAPATDPADEDRSFIAEVRWWETKPGGELRFGVDYTMEPDRSTRREAYDLASSMTAVIDAQALRDHIMQISPVIGNSLDRPDSGRPSAKGDWGHVIENGFASPGPGQRRTTRRSINPGFYGDETQRFQAITGLRFDRLSAPQLTDLLDLTLRYLRAARH